MAVLFYSAAAIAVIATVLAITRSHPLNAILYLIVSFLGLSVVLYLIGAPFIAALEIITYAGAIMVLFLFAIMLLQNGPVPQGTDGERKRRAFPITPVAIAALLLVELIYAIARSPASTQGMAVCGPQQVGAALFGPYILGVELASLLLLAGLIGAFHLGRRVPPKKKGDDHGTHPL